MFTWEIVKPFRLLEGFLIVSKFPKQAEICIKEIRMNDRWYDSSLFTVTLLSISQLQIPDCFYLS
ncbi:hypothetical protein BV375_28250 [Nostoc sp. 106C]|nr:hypothetical protein BV375_28250 [Nostoc sp. 106C]